MSDADPWDVVDQQPRGDYSTPDELASLANAASNRPPETFPLADLGLWSVTTATAKRFTMEWFIPENEITIMNGAGGANKSTFGLQLAASNAAEKSLLGVPLAGGCSLYATAEDDERQLHWVLQHICETIGAPLSSLAGKLHISSIRGRINNELATFDADGRIRATPAFALLKSTLEATKAKLLILDNAAHFFAGNENDRAQVTAFINLLYSLCLEHGVTIVLIAHPNKSGDSYSGSTAWLNAVRSQITIAKPEDSLDPDERVLTVGKANYARQGETLKFRWHNFALVRDDDLPPRVLEGLTETSRATADNAVFMGCLIERNKQRRAVSEKHSPSFAPTEFAKMAESKAIGKARLEAAMDRLFRIGAIERAELWKGDDRKPVFGLRETAGNGAVNTVRETRETPLEPAEMRAGNAANIHTPPKGGNGAALEGPPPSPSGRVLFPADALLDGAA